MPAYNQNLASEVLPKAAYRFTVKEASTHYSKQGNEMIELKLAVRNLIVFDRLVFTEKAYWKIDQFRIAVGQSLGPPGSSVEIEPEDLIGLSGIVALDVEEYNGKQKNVVAEYCNPATTFLKEEMEQTAPAAPPEESQKPSGIKPIRPKAISLVTPGPDDPDDIPF